MGLPRGFVCLLLLHLLQGSDTSLVRLNGNGYEDVIIAIDPAVPEDETIIERIKEMVTTASTYMFEATEKRFFFKNVSILIPESWKNKPEYMKPKQESYKHADVKVAPPALEGRDEPYTRQFTECGEKAEYIHFTPDFILGKKEKEYGPSGRMFVHEWAHLRWGVFDEYSNDQPFYKASSKKIEATRCTTGITGVNKVYKCQGDSCSTRSCRINSTTKLYEKDCQFFPDKVQSEKASIMYMQSIDSVTEFCKEENHNRDAPSPHNLKCNYRSTWDVISSSEDFNNSVPMETPPSPPTFSLLRINERISCLVLDVSGSMAGYDRLNRMNQAAQYFLMQVIENGSKIGMVHFNHQASIKSQLIQINNDTQRHQLVDALPTAASGGTSICSGIRKAFEVFKAGGFQTDGADIMLLTDGEDSTAKDCIDEVKESGSVVNFIPLGPSADEAVINMSTLTGGSHLYASDKVQNNGLIDAFGALASENVDVTQKSLQLESKGVILNNNNLWLNDTVVIDSTVGKDTFFLVTWNATAPGISLWDPKGTQITNFTMNMASKMAYLSIPGTAQVGTWTYNLKAKVNQEILTITVNSRAASSSVPPITVNAKMNKDTSSFPSPMIIYAEVLQGYTPIIGAHVTAIIESNSGTITELELLDNGAGADAFKGDGVYSRYFTAYSENGRYSLKVRADGGANSARRSFQHPSSRAAYIPGWVVDGKIEGNPPRPETTGDTQPILENFRRTASGGAFVVSSFSGSLSDQFPPSQITDLQAILDGEDISLTWTAPGDDFDVGKAQQYIIRISESVTDLRDNFDRALQVNTTSLLPNEANSKETFAFKPENISEENATYIFIAIKSVDKSSLTSKMSNIAQVALFTPQAEPDPDSPGGSPHSGVSISTIVLSVVGSVVLVCIIVSATVCILKSRRSSSKAVTTF
ncbi:LOW QUALITY PROTEIN: calcium-activated chloride channel regulator 4 [Mesocricetus auratus]|uniref:LOW QUALITY PROTEIN: calcium-activated chloride channel regulator 4 n=1 Tax=Mesocricetus auratus TaxID=10036 RepID=A0ABM2XY47_MESAU|nr:LOW QUALITY PROTEIN: calcium-activated chloride channel regulator 4 [Mesocricetus auratus]